MEDSGGYPPPLNIYISDAYSMSGGYFNIFKLSGIIFFSVLVFVTIVRYKIICYKNIMPPDKRLYQ